MSIRHYSSDIDALDDMTCQLLGSRFRKVAMDNGRHEPPRHWREHGSSERQSARKPRRHRDRHTYE